MRKLLGGLVMVLAILGLVTPAFCAELKLAYVDTVKVFNDYQRTKDYDQVLQGKQKGLEGERDKKIAELKKLQDQYVLLSDNEKEKKKGEIEKKAQDLDEFRRKTLADLRKEQNDYMSEIVGEIDKVVKKQAKDGGFDFVLNGQAVLSGKPQYDLTEKVLKELNGGYTAKKK